MTRKFFGTDGIRGLTNKMPMTAEMALKIGQAAGAHFLRGEHRHRVVIGKDTRLSGYMMETALIAGFTSVGMDVVMVGPVPTPAVAMLTHSMRADLGVMISASHNKFVDNGIKLFGPEGYKLSDEDERAIEARLEQAPKLVPAEAIGRSKKIEDARGRYIHAAKLTFPPALTLAGLKVVIDCANGAAYQVAPSALWELGAEVKAIGVSPNGININDECGSTDTGLLKRTVVETGADIGLALDGDADRLIVVDETGEEVDGDQLMALIASSWNRRGALKGGGIVRGDLQGLEDRDHSKVDGKGNTKSHKKHDDDVIGLGRLGQPAHGARHDRHPHSPGHLSAAGGGGQAERWVVLDPHRRRGGHAGRLHRVRVTRWPAR